MMNKNQAFPWDHPRFRSWIGVARACQLMQQAVTRAIAQRQVVRLKYFSHGSGLSERELVPFALVSDGLRWHARVFDRKRQRFGDFVITRMENVTVLRDAQPNSAVAPHERASEDHQWHRMIDLELMPHPLSKLKEKRNLVF